MKGARFLSAIWTKRVPRFSIRGTMRSRSAGRMVSYMPCSVTTWATGVFSGRTSSTELSTQRGGMNHADVEIRDDSSQILKRRDDRDIGERSARMPGSRGSWAQSRKVTVKPSRFICVASARGEGFATASREGVAHHHTLGRRSAIAARMRAGLEGR